ncbi:MAG TPA: cytochrome c, partial [Rhodanobacteraceae bacterium]|nr:cytochrome c [Rhodanobacteraceae bacterium]
MGFRRPLALLVLIAAAAPFAVLSAPQAQTAAEPATAASSAPAGGASAAAPAQGAVETAEAAFAKLAAVKTQPGDPKAGQAKAAACGACHGMDGNSTDPQYPKLADQSEQYIVTQLMRFKSGVRVNAIMAGMAAALSPQDMHDIAAYFAGQKRLPGVTDEKLAGDGEKLYREGDASRDVPACMACHGPDGV